MMQSKLLLIFIFLISVSITSFAQKRKSKARSQASTQSTSPTALDPVQEQRAYSPKSRKTSKSPSYQAEEEFYERMAKLEKTKRKNEALMQKPQYSDPMYFGHKRPPKKNKPGKMKYCKECGMRH